MQKAQATAQLTCMLVRISSLLKRFVPAFPI